jgi:ketopantoate hydroxymethyltransferase
VSPRDPREQDCVDQVHHPPPSIQARKGGEAIVCLTSYTAPMTRLVDPHADLILVGDSLANDGQ